MSGTTPSGPSGPRRSRPVRRTRSNSLPGIHKLGSHSVERAPEDAHTEHHTDIDPTPEEPIINRSTDQLGSVDEAARKLQSLIKGLAPKLEELDAQNCLKSTEFGKQLGKAAENILKIKEKIGEDEKLSKKQKKRLLSKLESALNGTGQLYHAFHVGISSAKSGTSEMNMVLAGQKSKFEPESEQYKALNNLQGLLSKFQMSTVSATTAIFNPQHPGADPESYDRMLGLGKEIQDAAEAIMGQGLLEGEDLENFAAAMGAVKNLTNAQNALFELKDELLAELTPKERTQLEDSLKRVGELEQHDKLIGVKIAALIVVIALVIAAILTGVIVFTPAMIGSYVVGLIVLNELFPNEIEGSLPSKTLKSLDDYMATVDQLCAEA